MAPQHSSRRSWGHKEIKQQHYIQMLPGILCELGTCHRLCSANDFFIPSNSFGGHALQASPWKSCQEESIQLLCSCLSGRYCLQLLLFLCLHLLDINTGYLFRES